MIDYQNGIIKQAIEMGIYMNRISKSHMEDVSMCDRVLSNIFTPNFDTTTGSPGTWSREVLLTDKPLQIHSFKYKAGEYQALKDYIKVFNMNSENLKEGFYPFKLDYRGITPWVYNGTVVVYLPIPYLENEDEYMVNRPILSVPFKGIAQDTINIIESISFAEDLHEYMIEK